MFRRRCRPRGGLWSTRNGPLDRVGSSEVGSGAPNKLRTDRPGLLKGSGRESALASTTSRDDTGVPHAEQPAHLACTFRTGTTRPCSHRRSWRTLACFNMRFVHEHAASGGWKRGASPLSPWSRCFRPHLVMHSGNALYVSQSCHRLAFVTTLQQRQASLPIESRHRECSNVLPHEAFRAAMSTCKHVGCKGLCAKRPQN